MKTKSALLLLLVLCLSLTCCNNVIHDLVPWDAEEGDGLPTTPSYTVRFDRNGGTTDASPAAKTVIPPAATIDALPAVNPTWAGRDFLGWWTGNGYGGNWGTSFTASTPVTADITVYARWNPPPNYYTVSFNKNNNDAGSTEASPAAVEAAAGNTVNPLPVQPARTGYTFVGWNTAANGSGTAFTVATVVTADITVYAQWTANIYTVRFDRNSGTTDASPAAKTVIPPAATIDALPAIDPTWAGHDFQGWWTENGFGGNWGREFTASTPVTADITVYARWNPPPNYYTVTFNKNNTDSGSTEADPQTAVVTDGGTVNPLPTAPARTGYTFAGWNRAANGSGTAFDETTTVTANITVYAKWTANTYTVTFDKNGGTTDASPAVKTVTVPTTTIDALPTAAPTWAGHTFEGWWTKNGDGGDWGIEFTATTTVSANITVYAKWNPPPNYYLVTFNKNNTDSGSTEANPRTASVADGGTVNPLPTQPARTGYTFGGWNTAADGSGTVFDASTPVVANITVYAQWTANAYTVTFDKNNSDSGSTEASPQTAVVADGGTVNPLPTQPARTGYTFGGWNTAADGSGTVFDASTPVVANITVYAQWTANAYTVTFDKNNSDSGSTEASPQTAVVADGGTVNPLPTQPARTGYTFGGWNTVANGSGTVFDASTPVVANITVYAQWTANAYTVTFDKNNSDSGSTEASPQTAVVADGGTINPLPAQPARTGYTFGGWNTAADGSGTVFDASTPVVANITVYAQWTANAYTVTFDKNNTDSGSTEASPNSLGVAAGSIVNPMPTQPTRLGYSFDGWWTQNGSGGNWGTSFTASTPVTANITVYAKWVAASLKLVINGSSGTFTIPTNNTWAYDWTIDWGDGNIVTQTGTGASGSGTGISHTYTANPQYTIEITANSNTGHAAFGFGSGTTGANTAANKQKLLKALGHIKENTSVAVFPNAWNYCFYNCTNLNEVSPDLLPAIPNGTRYIFSNMFYGCSGLSSLPAGFQLPAVPNGTSGIFASMFNNCTSLSLLPAGFQLPAVPNGTSDIFSNMFYGCSGLSSLPVGFQLPAVPNGTGTIFYRMFFGCSSLSSLPIGFQLPAVPNGTDYIFSGMFLGCTSLGSLPAAFQLPAVPNGTSGIFYEMFYGCSGLSSLPAGFQLPAVPNGTSSIFSIMFYGCTSLGSLPAGFQLPAVPNGTDYIFSSMFGGCTSLSSLPAGFQLPAVPNGTNNIFDLMFSGCSVLNTNIENLIGSNIFSSGQENYTYFMSRTFRGCSSLTGSALNALSMGFHGNTTTPPPTPSTDLDTFASCPASVTVGLHAYWQ